MGNVGIISNDSLAKNTRTIEWFRESYDRVAPSLISNGTISVLWLGLALKFLARFENGKYIISSL
jgi:hypothetical protein